MGAVVLILLCAAALVLFVLNAGPPKWKRLSEPLVEASTARGGSQTRKWAYRRLPDTELGYGPSLSKITGGATAAGLPWQEAETVLDRGGLPKFVLKARGTFSRVPALGVDKEFDHQFAVECDDPDAVRAVWTPRAAELAVRLGNPVLTEEGQLPAYDLTIETNPQGFRIRFNRIFKHKATYDALFDLIESLVEAAGGSASA